MAAKARVLITLPPGVVRGTFFPKRLVEQLEKKYALTWNGLDRNWTTEELCELVAGHHACAVGWGAPYWSSSVVERAVNLKCIGILGGSVRPYLSKAVFEAGIPVFNAAEMMAESVAEAAIAYALAGLRQLPQYMNAMKQGLLWRESDYWVEGLLYQTVGLVGFGAVGRFLAQQLQAFKCKLLIYDPYLKGELPPNSQQVFDLPTLFSQSKVISVQAAYTEETHHLIDQSCLNAMSPGSVLINVGRGGLIDEAALIERLKGGDVSAVLDVFTKEPLPLTSELRQLPNAHLIPHMAGPTPDLRWRMTEKIFRDFDAVLENKPYSGNLCWDQVQAMT